MVVLDPGDPAAARGASLAVQAFANGSAELPDDIELLQVHVGEGWPDGVRVDVPPHLAGELAVGWAEMTGASHGRVALAWHQETTGVGLPQFRTVDPNEPPGRAAPLAEKGGAVLSLVRGAGVHDGAFTGSGFGVVWRDHNAPGIGPVRPMLAVVDDAGAPVLGPVVVAGPDDYPGPSPALGWNGSKYLLGVPFDECHVDDTICFAHSIVLAELRPGREDERSHLEALAAIPTLDPATVPTSVMLATFDREAWLAWVEPITAGDEARVIRAVRLDGEGRPSAEPVRVAERAALASPVSLSVTELGPVLSWVEKGDAGRPSNELGASFVAVQQLDHDGAPRAPAIRIASTAVDGYGPPMTVALTFPSTLLVVWAAHGTEAMSPTVGWLARLDCINP
jgi:hypothetical protein